MRNFCALPHNYDGMQCDTGLNTCQCNKSLTALTYNNWLFLLCYYLGEESYPAVRTFTARVNVLLMKMELNKN